MTNRSRSNDKKAKGILFDREQLYKFLDSSPEPEDALLLLNLIRDYFEYGAIPDHRNIKSPDVIAAFYGIARLIDYGKERYEETCAARKEAWLNKKAEEEELKKRIRELEDTVNSQNIKTENHNKANSSNEKYPTIDWEHQVDEAKLPF